MKTGINKTVVGAGLIFIMVSFLSNAQVSGGIVAGVSTGSVEIDQLDRRFSEVAHGQNIMGIEGGLYLKVKAGPLYVKPMALLSYQSGELTYQDQVMDYHSNKLGIPILFGLHVIGPLTIEAGPVYKYVVNVTENYNSSTDVSFGKNGIGYRAGLALDFGTLILNASYEGMTYHASSSDQTAFREPNKLLFGVGLRLGGHSDK